MNRALGVGVVVFYSIMMLRDIIQDEELEEDARDDIMSRRIARTIVLGMLSQSHVFFL